MHREQIKTIAFYFKAKQEIKKMMTHTSELRKLRNEETEENNQKKKIISEIKIEIEWTQK